MPKLSSPQPTSLPASLVDCAKQLSAAVDALSFAAPITHVFNPLNYAAALHHSYLTRYGQGKKRVLFLGMNPGPFGMMQTGVPFGEVAAVKEFLNLSGKVQQPAITHPSRPIEGLDCPRSEVSGRRLWALFAELYGSADAFFADHFVSNYCPLAFLSGTRNITPDKLPKNEAAPLFAACDLHLQQMVDLLQPALVIGIGKFARKQAEKSLAQYPQLRFADILHPSPASPAANKDWAGTAKRQLEAIYADAPLRKAS